MTFAYDNYIQFPTRDLYDSAIMKMAIDAAKDMYDKGEDQLKQFYKDYGDFTSPFAKDMARYGEMVGGVRDMINDAYAHGVDLLRTPQGRAMISQAINKINPAELNMMRSNAKTGYAYLDAMQKLRSQGKYSEAQELFDIAFNHGTQFNDFATAKPGELGFNSWTRTSPIEATSLRDLTKSAYEGRQARLLSASDFNDPRLAGKYTYDPKYEWSGYLYSDLMKGAPGASLAIAGDPRAQFFRDEARKRVIAAGLEPTETNIEAQFQKDIADANTWALIDPTRKADEFALDDHRTKNDDWLDSRRQSRQHYYHNLENGGGDGNPSTETGWNIPEDVYVNSLADAAGVDILQSGGAGPLDLNQWVETAAKNQNAKISSTGDVLTATGMRINPQKLGSLIQSDQKNGRGYFLNSAYFKNLREIDDIRSSYKGWMQKGKTKAESIEQRKSNKEKSKEIVSNIRNWDRTDKKHGGFRLKVVPVPDDNGNNVYGMVGDDGRWHTYARVRVYMSNGSKTMSAGTRMQIKNQKTKKYTEGTPITEEGREMLLEVGLHSNEGKGTPDYTRGAMEELGAYGYDQTSKWVGRELNTGFPWANNTVKKQE